MSRQSSSHTVSRAQQAFLNAFLSLLTTVPYTDISVRDIIEAAQYSRSAFYLHFRDKEDFMQWIIANEVHNLLALSPPSDNLRESAENAGRQGLCAFFEHVYANRRFYTLLLDSKFPHLTVDDFCELLQNKDAKRPSSVLEAYPDLDYEFFEYMEASQSIDLIRYWRQHNFKYSPEYMAEQAYHFSVMHVSFSSLRLKWQGP